MNTDTQKIIKDRNKKFNSAKTNAERRVLIAKDVIAQIKTNKIVPEEGNFVSFNVDHGVDYDKGVRESIIDNETQCTCCALGSLMVSCTLFNNNYKLFDAVYEHNNPFAFLGDFLFSDKKPLKNKLDKYFSRSQLKLIEIAFERGNGYFGNIENRSSAKDLANFSKQERMAENMFVNIFNAKYRLITIMKNIIKNKGTFVPTEPVKK